MTPARMGGGLVADDVVRPARPGHTPALSELARSPYVRYVDDMGKQPREDYAALVADTEIWVADNGKVLIRSLALDDEPDHPQLNNLAVAPRAPGTGLGAWLANLTVSGRMALGPPRFGSIP